MMTDPLFIAYYTPGPYEGDARMLCVSLDTLGLEHCIQCVETPEGGWSGATNFKPKFIQSMMIANPKRPLVYIDVDAFVVSRPDLFWTLKCDIAVHIFPGNMLLSGTIFLGNTVNARKIVDAWIAECEMHPKTWDQISLQNALKRRPFYEFKQLPYSYVWMVGGQQMTGTKLDPTPPVIIHTRGSLRHNPEHK